MEEDAAAIDPIDPSKRWRSVQKMLTRSGQHAVPEEFRKEMEDLTRMLPDELWVSILRIAGSTSFEDGVWPAASIRLTQLMHIPAVCHRWKMLCEHRISVDLDLSWAVKHQAMEYADGYTPYSFELSSSSTCSVSDVGFAAMSSRFKAITSLTLKNCHKLTAKCVVAGGQLQRSRLRGLALSGATDDRASSQWWEANWDVDPELLDSLIWDCDVSHLESLSLSCLPGISIDGVMAAVIPRCTRLTSITVRNSDLSDAGLKSIAACRADLKTFDFEQNEHEGMQYGTVTDGGLAELLKACPKLDPTRLVREAPVGDASIQAVAVNFPGLSSLDLDNSDVTAHGIRTIAENFSKLTDLSLPIGAEGFDDELLLKLAVGCPCLKSLRLPDESEVTDAGLVNAWALWPDLLPKNLHGAETGNEFIKAVATRFPRLRALDLTGNHRTAFNDSMVATIASQFPELTYLNMHTNNRENGSKLTDVHLAAIAAGCPKLLRIYVSGNQVTDAGKSTAELDHPQLSVITEVDYSSMDIFSRLHEAEDASTQGPGAELSS